MKFLLTWFEKDKDELVGSFDLEGVTEDQIRDLYNIKPDEFAGFCKQVNREQAIWIGSRFPDLTIDLEIYEFFIEPYNENFYSALQ